MLIVTLQTLSFYPMKGAQQFRQEAFKSNAKSEDERNLQKIIDVSLYPESIRLDRDDIPDLERGRVFYS